MDMNFSKLQETVKDGEAWLAAVHGATKSLTWLSNWKTTSRGCLLSNQRDTHTLFVLLFTRVNFFIWSLPIFLFLVSIWTHCWSLTPYSWWREPRRTFPGHNDSFLLHAFRTLSLPGSFIWCIESLLSWEFKGPMGETLNQEEERQLKESHPSFSGTCWITSEADRTQLLGVSPVGSQLPTAVSNWSVLLSLTLLPSLSHFPYSLTCASWNHLPNTLPGPRLLVQCLLWASRPNPSCRGAWPSYKTPPAEAIISLSWTPWE